MNGGETTVAMADETSYLFTVSKDDVAMPRVQMGTLAACMLVYVPMRVPLVSHFAMGECILGQTPVAAVVGDSSVT